MAKEGFDFENIKTPHLIIVEDKIIKWLVSGLIKKINGNYNIIEEANEEDKEKNKNINYVENDKKDICCGIYTINGRDKIKIIPGTTGFDNLKSILLIVDNDAKAEIENFSKKLQEREKELNRVYYCRHCLIPSKSGDGKEIEDYIFNKLKNSDRVKFEEIGNFINFFINKFQLNISCPPKRINKRILNILVYIESKNLRDLEEDKRKYVENTINNIAEEEEVFAELKNFFIYTQRLNFTI